jgi:TRAP-type C4-dicarboxylate transport system permease small subunit
MESMAAGLLIAAVLLNFSNVLARYVFASPIVIAEEMLQYSNVWVVMLALPAVTLLNIHLRMEFLAQLASAPVGRIVEIAITLLGIGLMIYVVVQSGTIIGMTYDIGQRSVAAGLPLYLVHFAVPVGFGCAILALLTRLWRLLSGRSPRAMDAASVE